MLRKHTKTRKLLRLGEPPLWSACCAFCDITQGRFLLVFVFSAHNLKNGAGKRRAHSRLIFVKIFVKFCLWYEKKLIILSSCCLDVSFFCCFFFYCCWFSLGFCFLLLRRQNLTSWPPFRTCCDSVSIPHPSCSPSASSSPSSSTSCPDRRSSASFRYNTILITVGFVSTSPTFLCIVTCSDLHLHPCCSAFRHSRTWNRHSRISPTWRARWDQVPRAVVREKGFWTP